jgi:hypothetical protein
MNSTKFTEKSKIERNLNMSELVKIEAEEVINDENLGSHRGYESSNTID